MQNEEFDYSYARSQIERRQNPLRKFVKSFYIRRVLRHVTGTAVDLGCGAGQILECLPPGSLGVEVNPHLIDDLTKRGLRVLPAQECEVGLNLEFLNANEFSTIILSHVLEHFNHADLVLRKLLNDCEELGITTVIIVVPGYLGFRSDPTHKTFINMHYLQTHDLITHGRFRISHHSYFPINFKFIGKVFVYNELMIVYTAPRQAT